MLGVTQFQCNCALQVVPRIGLVMQRCELIRFGSTSRVGDGNIKDAWASAVLRGRVILARATRGKLGIGFHQYVGLGQCAKRAGHCCFDCVKRVGGVLEYGVL